MRDFRMRHGFAPAAAGGGCGALLAIICLVIGRAG